MNTSIGRALAGLLFGSALVGTPSRSQAQEVALPAVGAPLDGRPATRPRSYAGVLPGSGAANPLPKAPGKGARLIWTGFTMEGPSAQVFLQTTDAVDYEIAESARGRSRAGRGLTVFLRNTRIHLKNNARRLDTRFFPTAVRSVVARQRRRDVVLEIALAEAARPEASRQDGPDGTSFLVLTFGGERAPEHAGPMPTRPAPAARAAPAPPPRRAPAAAPPPPAAAPPAPAPKPASVERDPEDAPALPPVAPSRRPTPPPEPPAPEPDDATEFGEGGASSVDPPPIEPPALQP